MAKLKIGVLGTGDVGQVLGAGFAALEHDVKIGSREPGSDKVKKWLARAGAQGSAGSFADAAASGTWSCWPPVGAAPRMRSSWPVLAICPARC